MATKKPLQPSGLNTEFFQLRETVPNLEKSQKLNKKHDPVRSVQGLFTYFDNPRFTLGDALCVFLLGFVSILLITNITRDLNLKVEANLLGLRAEIPAKLVPLKIINPIPAKFLEASSSFVSKKDICQSIDTQMILATKKETIVKTASITSKKKVVSKKQPPRKIKRPVKKQPKKIVRAKAAKPLSSPKAKIVATQTNIQKKQPLSNKKKTAVVSTWQQTKSKAMKEGKSSFVLFGAPYCMPCLMMKDVLQKHQNVKNYLDTNYQYEYVDIQTGYGKLMQLEYNIQRLPTMIIFDKNGRQVAKYEESLSSQRLLSVFENYNSLESQLFSATKPITTSPKKTSPQRKREINTIIMEIKETYVGREKK